MLSAELDDRDARRRERCIHEAHFPRLKHLADFDFEAAPTVDPAMLPTLERGEWIASGQPVVLLGDSGTGKSHLLIGLGMAACQRGLRVRYTTAAALVNELAEAADERTLSRVVARYGRLDLLCLDEFGYVHLDPRGAGVALATATSRWLYQYVGVLYRDDAHGRSLSEAFTAAHRGTRPSWPLRHRLHRRQYLLPGGAAAGRRRGRHGARDNRLHRRGEHHQG